MSTSDTGHSGNPARRPGMVRRAFTLVELLIVISIIAILASLLLPALGRAKAEARVATCLNNKQQLILAWQMYANENNDVLVLNSGLAGLPTPYEGFFAWSWCYGYRTWNLNPGNTNTAALTDPRASLLAAYTGKSVDIYRCTEDNYLSSVQRRAGWRFRMLGVGMNWFVGGGRDRLDKTPTVSFLKLFRRMDEFSDPPDINVILDKHPDSLGDPFFDCAGPAAQILHLQRSSTGWIHLPGSLHHGGGTLVAADGHAYLRKWKDAATKPPIEYSDYMDRWAPVTPDPGSDIDWFVRHATELKETPSR